MATTRRRALAGIAAVTLVATTFAPQPVRATGTITVGPPGTSAFYDFHDVQAALDAAASGDVVEVAPGRYGAYELDFAGKDLTLRAQQGPDVTILDGYFDGSVVKFDDGETRAAVIEGFTITRGYAYLGDGGGIHIAGSSPTVRGNHIVDNLGCAGIGVSVRSGSPLIVDNFIARNEQQACSGGSGGGISVVGAGPATTEIVGNTIVGNRRVSTGGGIDLFAAGAVSVVGNVIAGNDAFGVGGIDVSNGTGLDLRDNLVVGNVGRGDAGTGLTIAVPSGSGWSTHIARNTFAENVGRDPSVGPVAQIEIAGEMDRLTFEDNVVVGDHGTVFCGEWYRWSDANWSGNVLWNRTTATSGFVGPCVAPDASNPIVEPGLVVGGFEPAAGSPLVDALGPDAGVDAFGVSRPADGDGDGLALSDRGGVERTGSQPVAPTVAGLTASRVVGNVEVAWTPEPGTIASQVRVGTNQVETVWSSAGSFSTAGYVSDQPVTVRVRAIGAAGAGPWTEATAPPLASAPSPVVGLDGTRDGSVVRLSWQTPQTDGGSPILGYRVSMAGAVYETSDTELAIADPSPSSPLSASVVAFNAVGESVARTVWLDPVLVVTPPGAPATGTAERQSRNRLVVTWTPPADDGGAPISAYTVTEMVSGQTVTLSASARSTTFSGIGKKADYRLEIVAVNSAGPGAPLVVDAGGGGDDGGGGGGGGGNGGCHPKKGC